eukprot:3083302-Rhodomonas_salina.2
MQVRELAAREASRREELEAELRYPPPCGLTAVPCESAAFERYAVQISDLCALCQAVLTWECAAARRVTEEEVATMLQRCEELEGEKKELQSAGEGHEERFERDLRRLEELERESRELEQRMGA